MDFKWILKKRKRQMKLFNRWVDGQINRRQVERIKEREGKEESV